MIGLLVPTGHRSELRFTQRQKRFYRGLFALMLAMLTIGEMQKPALGMDRTNVWFSPDNDSPDLLDLFRHPELWENARSRVGVIKFGPAQLDLGSMGVNSFSTLNQASAFDRIRSWGMRIASEEGALKEWDCVGADAVQISASHNDAIRRANASVGLIALDSPLLSGTGPCGLSIGEAAKRTADYVAAVNHTTGGHALEFGDIEPYPQFSIAVLKEWTKALKEHGFAPSFFDLDINLHYIDVHNHIPFASDLQELAVFLRSEGIRFGIIFWSGYDPLNSDRAYYDHTMSLARRVKVAIGAPDRMIFQSWVTRAPLACRRSDVTCKTASCLFDDPPYCGKKSIPLNLPEGDPTAFTHTRLINDILNMFEHGR